MDPDLTVERPEPPRPPRFSATAPAPCAEVPHAAARMSADVPRVARKTAAWRRGLHLVTWAFVVLTVVVLVTAGNHYLFDILAGCGVLLACWRIAPWECRAGEPAVLLLSAGMGAGHDGVAHELQRRIIEAGGRADVLDYLMLMPLYCGRLMKGLYAAQLRYAPSSYEWLYDALERVPMFERCGRMIAVSGRHRLRRRLQQANYGLTVATYPLAGQALGQLRRRGRLPVPAVTFLTDLDVHTMWLDPDTDLYLSVYHGSAREAEQRTGRPAIAVGPVLPPSHTAPVSPRERAAARARLGRGDGPLVLLVTGSWGVGDVLPTVSAIAASGFGPPLVLCGRNERLRRAVTAQGAGIAVGWTDDVRSLLAAADAVVHNAGGLSSLEGFAAGVPVIGHACLPGHGERNARAMRDAGVAALAEDTEDLVRLLHELAGTAAGRAMAARARGLFSGDPIPVLLAQAAQAADRAPVRSATLRMRLTGAGATLVATTLVATVLGFGISEASERYGFGLARPAAGLPPAVYVGALLDSSEVGDPQTVALLRRADVSAVVPAQVALSHPRALQALAAAGLSTLTTEDPRDTRRPEAAERAAAESIREIHAATRQRRVPVALLHRLTPLMLVTYSRAHALLGSADAVFRPGDAVAVRDRGQVVVDLQGAGHEASTVAVESLQRQAVIQRLTVRAWGSMWGLP